MTSNNKDEETINPMDYMPPDDLIDLPIQDLALRLGERICRLAKWDKLLNKTAPASALSPEEVESLKDTTQLGAMKELNMVFAAKTALRCRMKDFIPFIHRVNTGKPLADNWIKKHFIEICTALANERESK